MAAAPASCCGSPRPGSVDDGKSTLIGRLLLDAKLLLEDRSTRCIARPNGTPTSPPSPTACAPSASRASRSTSPTATSPRRARSFIIADTPGHERYTRNMVTGASTADLAVDPDRRPQRDHRAVAPARLSPSLLGIRHLVAAVNKMDLVDWDEARFREIEARVRLARPSGSASRDAHAIPISALHGDNVVERGERRLVRRPAAARAPRGGRRRLATAASAPLRLPVQWVIRPADGGRGARRYAGQMAGGTLRPGDEVVVLPARRAHDGHARSSTLDGPLEAARSRPTRSPCSSPTTSTSAAAT